MNFKKTGFWGGLILLGVAAVFAGCNKNAPGQKTAENDKTSVTITTIYAVGNQITADLMHARVEGYMKLNPHVTIVEKLSNEGAYLDSIRTLDAVGELPDMIEMRDTPLFVRAGKLGELPPEIINLFEKTVAYDGKVYTAPIDESYPTGIVYSKKIFNQLGIKAADIKTYNDFLGVCEKIKNAGIAPIVVGGADIWHIGFWWNYFWHQEVAVKDPDWIAHRYEDTVHFTDVNIKAALSGLNELFQKGYIEKGWTSTGEGQCPSILVSGRAAMYFIGPFAFQQIAEADPSFEFGFFAIPDKNGKINVTGGPTHTGWAITVEAQKDPARRDEIYSFIRYFFSRDVYTDYLATANALSSLKEKYTYQASEQFQVVLALASSADNKQLTWNQKSGVNELPPNFRNFCYKLASEWFLNVSSIDAGLRTMDQEWANAAKNFNPVTGVR